MDQLRFEPEGYLSQTLCDGMEVRAWEGIVYIANPVSELQSMNLYAPAAYFEGGSVNGYTAATAPIFFPNTVGGFMPGPAATPQTRGAGATVAAALRQGYVVACPGARGNRLKDAAGRSLGRAPAAICDLKAAVRWLRHNAGRIPGDVERIIPNGTSAGGAMAALLGSTGNHPDYAPYLAQMGAAEARDDVFAASCYCPIIHLHHADKAYEWEFVGVNDYKRFAFGPNGPQLVEGVMDQARQALSRELAAAFPAHVAELGGSVEALEEQLRHMVIASAQQALDRGEDLSALGCLSIAGGQVTAVDFRAFVRYRGRMKLAPAFDDLALNSPETQLFCDAYGQARHFTDFGMAHSQAGGSMAEPDQIRMMDPIAYVGKADTAPHFRVRHGAADRDTSLAISALLVNALRAEGIDVDYSLPWGVPHAGDYDLPELFAWIDGLCR